MTTAKNIFARQLATSRIAARQLSARANHRLTIAYIGDSNTEAALYSRFGLMGYYMRSNAAGMIEGTGTLTIYENTVSWTAPGDTEGAALPGDGGILRLESGSADRWASTIMPQSIFSEVGSPEGTPVELDVIRMDYVGGGIRAPFAWGQILSGQKCEVTQWGGISGHRTAETLERMACLWLHDTYGTPIARGPDIVGCLISINDVDRVIDETFTLQEVLDRHTAIKNYTLAQGSRFLVATITAEAPTADQWTVMQAINDHIRAMAGPLVEVADIAAVLVDPEGVNGACLPHLMDGLHFHADGAKLAGEVIAQCILSMTDGRRGRSAFRKNGPLAARNVVTNGELAGTAGSKSGLTGDVALDTVFVGTGNCVGSKQSVPGENDWQVFNTTAATAGDTITMTTSAAYAPGEEISGQCEFDATGDGIKNITINAVFSDGDAEIERVYSTAPNMDPLEAIGTGKGVLQIPAINVPPWCTEGTFEIVIVLAGGNSEVKVRDSGIQAKPG